MASRSSTNTRNTGKARAKKPAARRRPPAQQSPPATLSAAHVQGFIAGTVAGLLMGAAGVIWLIDDDGRARPIPAQLDTAPEEESARPRFDFYTLLPEEELQLATPQAGSAGEHNEPSAYRQYILQAGSFRRPEDADRRKGELAFLGLESEVERSENDSGVWYRVYIGPFESRSEMARARSLSAQADIDTLLLKRSQP